MALDRSPDPSTTSILTKFDENGVKIVNTVLTRLRTNNSCAIFQIISRIIIFMFQNYLKIKKQKNKTNKQKNISVLFAEIRLRIEHTHKHQYLINFEYIYLLTLFRYFCFKCFTCSMQEFQTVCFYLQWNSFKFPFLGSVT
jgi:hypothetical protein